VRHHEDERRCEPTSDQLPPIAAHGREKTLLPSCHKSLGHGLQRRCTSRRARVTRARRVVVVAASILLVSACGSAGHRQSSASTTRESPIRNYPRPCGRHVASYGPFGLSSSPGTVSFVHQLGVFAKKRDSNDRLPPSISALFALLERVEAPVPKSLSVGAFRLRKSRFLQHDPATGASIYGVPSARGAVCYAIGAPVVTMECVRRLLFGISLELDQRDRSCAASFVAHGLAANDVVTVGLSAAGRVFNTRVRRNSFLIELPASIKPQEIRAVVISYSDHYRRSVPIRV